MHAKPIHIILTSLPSDGLISARLGGWLKQMVPRKLGPTGLGIFYLVRVPLQPMQHMIEALCSFLLPLFERFITQISYLIQIRCLCEALWFSRHLGPSNLSITILLNQIHKSSIKNEAIANKNRLIRFES